ncbi:50S ribosomal protein L25/general stress protein Ctc [Ruicaihuangia caeni]|uniref:50S ribosomal protein L25/general stress protein Ctc n=1 Tax=Ruicaihuangia caeni TaxID=3042517 RepID=UPI00338FBDF8
MSDDNKLAASVRNSFGKGAARKIRAAGRIPAVIYGHGTEPQHVELPGHQTMLAVRKANAVLELDIEGKSQLTLVKDVQRDPVRQIIEHVDLIVVKKGERVHVEVPVHIQGESFSGTIHVTEVATIRLEAEATHIPENVVVNIQGAEEGTQFLAKDVELPQGATLIDDPELLLVHVMVPAAPAEETAEAAEAPAAAAPAAEASE